jgi:aminopeptidase N
VSTLVLHRSPRARRLGAVALVAVLAASVTASHAEGVADPVAGSDGIGDPYFPADGNGGINVLHYDVHDSYAFGKGRLSGRTRLTIKATQSLSRFNLDLLLPVERVEVDGEPARFTKPSRHELQITPRTPLVEGSVFSVVVRYGGRPGPISYERERNWLGNRDEIVTMHEPHMAPWWFPANDHPLDKATFDIHVTVPSDRKVVANGRLVDRTVRGRKATTHWRAVEPMAPYLAFFAAGKFETRKGRYQGRPWYVAVSKQLPSGQRSGLIRLMKQSPRITAWLEQQLGPYPFSATGGLVTGLPVGFALENQTRPTYPAVSPGSTSLVVHELAHQWFGDSVSVEQWSDIWLNEGFATFLEVRYNETHGGPSGTTWLREAYGLHRAGDPFWDLRISDPGPRRMFDLAIYTRGAMALQALRLRVGEADFWRVLRGWVNGRRHANGSVADFRAYAETISGEDLDAFFTAWLDTPAQPASTPANGL